jgi:TRAP transporter TAXI family solute receptor
MISKRRIGKIICVLASVLLFMITIQSSAPAADQSKQRQEILIGGGSAGGFTALLAEGCAEAIRRTLPNWSLTSTIGEVASNIKLVNDGEMQLTIGNLELVAEANKGTGTYSKKALPNVKMVVNLLKEVTQFVLLEKVPINSIKEWKEKKLPLKINVQKVGSGAEVRNRRVLNAYGITYNDLKSWGCTIRHEGGTRSMSLIRDGLLDGSLFTGNLPNAGLMELGSARSVKILPIDHEIVQQLAAQGKCVKAVIRAGTYKWQTTDILSVAYGAGIAASTKLEPGVVREITRAFVEQLPYIRSLHKSLKSLTINDIADIPVDILHPEAREYFESKGIKFEQ